MSDYFDVFLDALKDSAFVFLFAFVIYVIFSFVEHKVSHLLQKHKKLSPAFGSISGLIPQCGVSVIASDLYLKSHITMGCLIAVFFACSDEALPILLSPQDGDFSKAIYIIPLLLIKLIGGFLVGFLTDVFIKKREMDEEEMDSHAECHHHFSHNSKIHNHVVHPLLHSLKIFAYAFVINLLFGLIIYWLGGEEKLSEFLMTNQWLSPIFTVLLSGLVPNCAASVVTTELFMIGGIPFGALVAGLCVNAGLGIMFLLKNKRTWKDIILIIGILWASGLFFGYATMLIMLLF